MRVHRALGFAGRARGIEPESGVVAAGGGGVDERLRRPHQRVERERALGQRGARASDDHRAHLVSALGHRCGERRRQRRRDDRRLGPAVLEHVGVVGGGEQGVEGDRHDAGVEATEKRHRPLARVEHQQQHALLAAQAEAEQAARKASRALGKLAIAETRPIVDERELVRPRCVGLEQVAREVQRVGRRNHGSASPDDALYCMNGTLRQGSFPACSWRTRALAARPARPHAQVGGDRLGGLGKASRQPRIRYRQCLDPGPAAGRHRARLRACRTGRRRHDKLAGVADVARASARPQRPRAAPRPARTGQPVRRGRWRRGAWPAHRPGRPARCRQIDSGPATGRSARDSFRRAEPRGRACRRLQHPRDPRPLWNECLPPL